MEGKAEAVGAIDALVKEMGSEGGVGILALSKSAEMLRESQKLFALACEKQDWHVLADVAGIMARVNVHMWAAIHEIEKERVGNVKKIEELQCRLVEATAGRS